MIQVEFKKKNIMTVDMRAIQSSTKKQQIWSPLLLTPNISRLLSSLCNLPSLYRLLSRLHCQIKIHRRSLISPLGPLEGPTHPGLALNTNLHTWQCTHAHLTCTATLIVCVRARGSAALNLRGLRHAVFTKGHMARRRRFPLFLLFEGPNSSVEHEMKCDAYIN